MASAEIDAQNAYAEGCSGREKTAAEPHGGLPLPSSLTRAQDAVVGFPREREREKRLFACPRRKKDVGMSVRKDSDGEMSKLSWASGVRGRAEEAASTERPRRGLGFSMWLLPVQWRVCLLYDFLSLTGAAICRRSPSEGGGGCELQWRHASPAGHRFPHRPLQTSFKRKAKLGQDGDAGIENETEREVGEGTREVLAGYWRRPM